MHRPLTWFAWFLVVLGIALMTILTRESGTVKWLCIALFSGFGNGILYPALMALAYATPKVEHKDDAVTNLAFFQSLGQTFGVAIGSSVLQNQLLKQLHKHPLLHNFAMRYVKDAFILVDIVRHRSSAGETLENAVADAFIASIRVIWVVMAALAAIAMVGSLLIRTDHVKQWRASQLGRPQSTSKGGQSKNSSVDSIA
jgi:fucose permease